MKADMTHPVRNILHSKTQHKILTGREEHEQLHMSNEVKCLLHLGVYLVFGMVFLLFEAVYLVFGLRTKGMKPKVKIWRATRSWKLKSPPQLLGSNSISQMEFVSGNWRWSKPKVNGASRSWLRMCLNALHWIAKALVLQLEFKSVLAWTSSHGSQSFLKPGTVLACLAWSHECPYCDQIPKKKIGWTAPLTVSGTRLVKVEDKAKYGVHWWPRT